MNEQNSKKSKSFFATYKFFILKTIALILACTIGICMLVFVGYQTSLVILMEKILLCPKLVTVISDITLAKLPTV